MAKKLELVGGDSGAFNRYLEEDPCFGKHYSPNAEACQNCTAVVVRNEKMALLSELCKAECEGEGEVLDLNRLTSEDIVQRFVNGQSWYDIWVEVLNGMDPEVAGVDARVILLRRYRYISENYEDVLIDKPPYTKELRAKYEEEQ